MIFPKMFGEMISTCTVQMENLGFQETIGPDPHTPGAPLPPSAYAADVGYLVDGTPLDAAGNNAVH